MTSDKKVFSFTTQTYVILLFLLGTILIVPLIDNKIIPGHDYVFQVSRIANVAEALQEKVFPVRIYIDEIKFWGTPVGVFYPGLFIYIPALLKVAGLPIEICYNSFVAMIFYVGLFSSWYGFTMLTRSKITGFFSAIFYISSGYYFIDAYIRNAVGELLALSFLPLAIASVIGFLTKSKISQKHYVLGILSISAIIESHVLTAVFLSIFSTFILLTHCKELTPIIVKRNIFLFCIIVLLNATFIVPFMVYYTKVPITISFVDLFSQEGWSLQHFLRFILCANFWLFILLSFFVFIIINKFSGTQLFKKFFMQRIMISYYKKYFFTAFLFFILSSSVVPWDFFYPLKKVFEVMQFPWRFLAIATLFFSACAGFGFKLLIQKNNLKESTIILLLVSICATNLFAFTHFSYVPFKRIEQKINWTRIPSKSDFDYLYSKINVEMILKQGNYFTSDAEISNWIKTLNSISFSYSANKNSTITLPLINYPGYVAMNHLGKKVKIEENNNHMIILNLPRGKGVINIFYEGLKLFDIADRISLITWALFGLYIINGFKQKYL